MKGIEQYADAADREHHVKAHEALLNSLGLHSKGMQQIVDLRAHHVASYLADNKQHAAQISQLHPDRQAEEILKLHRELIGSPEGANEETDEYLSNRGKSKDHSVIGRYYGARR
jgi:hypothetical protein